MIRWLAGIGFLVATLATVLSLLHALAGSPLLYALAAVVSGCVYWASSRLAFGWSYSRQRLDENVQFTVYRPQAVQPARWYPLLAFAHLTAKRPDAAPDDPDPLEEVKRQAEQLLQDAPAGYAPVSADSGHAIPQAAELTFVPTMDGVEFNPPRRTLLWQEDVHREQFRLRAARDLDGQTARGRMAVYLGVIRIATINLSIRVDSAATSPDQADADPAAASVAATSSACHKVFVSYSHTDTPIVEEVERWGAFWRNQFLRDATELRRGEVWSAKLERMIEDADEFMLLWSSHSMHSPFVRQEWEHALSLRREGFVCPCYWEEPMPEEPPDLPPEELARLHFDRLPLAETQAGPSSHATQTEPAPREAEAELPTTSGIKRNPPTPAPDYYAILGVARTASDQDIRQAYRRLAREQHPDVNNAPDAETRFRQLGEAYAVLSDPDKRQRYDRDGHAGGTFEAPPGAGMLDLFDQAFGFGAPGGSPNGPGRDLQHEVTIELGEVLTGATRDIELTRSVICETCQGSGARVGCSPVTCDRCGGEGRICQKQESVFGSMVTVVTCPDCGGHGSTITDPCETCDGRGTIHRTEPFTVEIPPGIEDGQHLQYTGYGDMEAGETGDLYVRVHVTPHDDLTREGQTVRSTVTISFWQAALGDQLTVATLDAEAQVRVEPGTQYGAEVVLLGKGLPTVRSRTRGDHIVTVEIATPRDLTPRQRELIEELAREFDGERTGG